MSSLKKPVALAVALLAFGAAQTGTAPASSLTTTPGVVYVLKTVVDDKGVHIPKDKFTKNGVTRYPRGALIRYEFVNKGSKTYSVHMWYFDSDRMRPGGHASLLVNWTYRGTFRYWRITVSKKQLKPLGTVIIF
jgi:hypothetical protein